MTTREVLAYEIEAGMSVYIGGAWWTISTVEDDGAHITNGKVYLMDRIGWRWGIDRYTRVQVRE